MADKKFTKEQRDAIEKDLGNMIVSAAAGSGKTTVLSERVLRRIENGASCERMLIVTFTKSAASEMRSRICEVLRDRYNVTGDEHLWRESLKIHSAQISTIDSFQVKVVRENFRKAGVSPNFSLLDDTEQSFLEDKVLDIMLGEYYASFPENFESMLSIFGGDNENEGVKSAISGFYNYMKSIPFADKWLEEKLSLYSEPEMWINAVCDELNDIFTQILEVYEAACAANVVPEKQADIITYERNLLRSICEACEKHDITLLTDAVTNVEKNRITFSGKDSGQQKLKCFRELLFKYLSSPLLSEKVLLNVDSDLEKMRPGISAFFNAVRDYSNRMTDEFKARNKYSFDAVAALSLSVIVDKYDRNTGKCTVTAEGAALKAGFDEIMIDEYQDINDRQDLFFRVLSDNNLFIVGDVKQSIYAFRRANPENFIRKTRDYNLIGLDCNFRSRKGVLDFSNYVFSRLFSAETGGLEYTEREYLKYGATYPESDTTDTEVACIITPGKTNSARLQSQYVAGRIKEMIASGMTVSDKNGIRPIKYSDIAVLMRKGKGSFDIYRSEFESAGIPVYASSGLTYFDTVEVNTILSLLAVICDPYNDIALFSVMTSALYGFTSEEMARIRVSLKKGRLYQAVCGYAENEEKASLFIDDIAHLRILASNIPLHRLIWHIYTDRGYLSAVSFGDTGGERRENLMKLYMFAKRYGQTADGGTAQFLSFVNRARTGKDKSAEASVPQGNFVRMMTIHASKGLEFPICFVTQLDDNYLPNISPVLFDDTFGAGAKIRNADMTSERPTLMRELIALRKKKAEIAENLRLDYVAFTRAKEKLIVVFSISPSKLSSTSQFISSYRSTRVSPVFLWRASSDSDMLLCALSHHECMSGLDMGLCNFTQPSDSPIILGVHEQGEYALVNDSCEKQLACGLSKEEIKRRFDFVYKHPLSDIPAGLSVTELAKKTDRDPDCGELFAQETQIEPPTFISGKEYSGAKRGTAIHRFCALADLEKDTAEEGRRLIKENLMTEEDVRTVNTNRIRSFVQSSLYERLKQAQYVRKEENFLVKVPASLYSPGVEGGEILLQGAMDAVYVYSDGVVILDYKSDACSAEELVARYSSQLRLYALAAHILYEKPVKAAYIWSFHNSCAVSLDIDGYK